MTTEGNGERRGLHQSLRSQMGYGTAPMSAAPSKTTGPMSAAANKSSPKIRRFISRRLVRTDTLMGITLKYGVTIQDLKRENKLWNNDHLFLRETLLIPLTPDNENLLDENDTIVTCDGSSSSVTSPTSPHSHLPNGDIPTQSTQGSTKLGNKHQDISNGAAVSSGSNGAAGSSSSTSASTDFFAKYDSSLAQLKVDVAKMEKNAASLEGIIEPNTLSLPPRKGSNTSRRDSNSSISSASERRGRYLLDEDSSASPVLLIRSRTNSRHVKSTIENLQQVNDDIFEL